MAITTTTDTLVDGGRNLIMQFTGTSDGSGPQERLTVKVPARVKIKRITATVQGGTVTLLWDSGINPVPFAVLTPNMPELDYSRFPLVNRNDGTGNILLSTSGFGLGSAYTVRLEMQRKVRKPTIMKAAA